MKRVKVTISLGVPNQFTGVGPWNEKTTLESFVEHWLEQGCYMGESGYGPDLPEGIKYYGFKLKFSVPLVQR